uniref:DUF295 domain-containing protein n=1 Tax=Macrostomum lignano TaxID=282301 RepID=A0A1I8JPP5_9PLAT
MATQVIFTGTDDEVALYYRGRTVHMSHVVGIRMAATQWRRPDHLQHSLAVVLVCCCVAKQMRQMLVKIQHPRPITTSRRSMALGRLTVATLEPDPWTTVPMGSARIICVQTANHSVLGSGGLANVGHRWRRVVVPAWSKALVGGATNGVVSGGSGVSMEWLRRAEIVANTRITWDGKELLHLMYNHCCWSKGLLRVCRLCSATRSRPSCGRQPVGEQQSLERIISEYLLQQHAQCPNPVSTCPAFSLLEPHRCSAPRTRSHAMRPANAAQRMRTKSYGQWRANPRDIGRENRRYLYSRFNTTLILAVLNPVRTFRDPEEDSPYSCCRLLTKRGRLLIGSAGGRLHQCEPVRDSHGRVRYLGQSGSRLFAYPNESVSVEEYDIERFHVMDFEDEAFVEFDPCSLSRVLTTKNNAACIYDVESKTRIAALYDQESSNDYLRNRAVFNADGNLVLNDGVLWDVRDSTRSVHKFDKFQNLISGVFHPNCFRNYHQQRSVGFEIV